jgi:hypothetical protein
MNIYLNNEGQECKTGPVRRTVLVGRGRVSGEGKKE